MKNTTVSLASRWWAPIGWKKLKRRSWWGGRVKNRGKMLVETLITEMWETSQKFRPPFSDELHVREPRPERWARWFKRSNLSIRMTAVANENDNIKVWVCLCRPASVCLHLKQMTYFHTLFLSCRRQSVRMAANKLRIKKKKKDTWCFVGKSLFLTVKFQWRLDWNLSCSDTAIDPLGL